MFVDESMSLWWGNAHQNATLIAKGCHTFKCLVICLWNVACIGMPNLMHIGMPNLKIQSFFLKEKCVCLDETQQTKIQSTVFSNANLEIHLFVERIFWLAIQCKTKFNLDKLDDIGCQDLLFCMFFCRGWCSKNLCVHCRYGWTCQNTTPKQP